MFHKAMDMAQPGDVIMIDAGGSMERSIFGELMVSYCHKRGISGIVLDGCIRDVDTLSGMDISVYAKGAHPNGPYKNGPGEINTPVALGGKVVFPGDIIVGDADGVVVIHPEDAEEVAAAAKEVMATENAIYQRILSEGTYHRPWVDEILRNIGCNL